jgi:hypothetical protein
VYSPNRYNTRELTPMKQLERHRHGDIDKISIFIPGCLRETFKKIEEDEFVNKNKLNHNMQLRKRPRLSEVAYTGYKRVRMVRKITRRDVIERLTEQILYFTTGFVVAVTILGLFYYFLANSLFKKKVTKRCKLTRYYIFLLTSNILSTSYSHIYFQSFRFC